MAEKNPIANSQGLVARSPLPIVAVLGSTGFIGSQLVRRLEQTGQPHEVLARDADLTGQELGCLVYCAGVTADFRERPLDTVDAHVSHLVHVLRNARVSSLVYLSSTRVYRRCGTVAEEDVLLSCCPSQVEDLYDISKMLGEAVTLTCSQPARVLRLSNVYGADTSSPTFLPSIIREATETGQIVLRTAMSSSKDYVSLGDVIDMILRVAAEGARPIYNIASGQNTSHEALVRCIAEITGCRVRAIPDAPEVVEPIVSIRRLQDEFGFMPKNVIDDLPELIQSMAKTEPAP